MNAILGEHKLHHICIVTRNLEKAKRNYAALTGLEVPETIVSKQYDIQNTIYMGEPAPRTGCEQVLFSPDNGMIMEYIMPNEGKSAWNDFLNEHGEGIHHFCFTVKDLDAVIERCGQYGMKLVQKGNFPGGHYAYLDAMEYVGAALELLEFL